MSEQELVEFIYARIKAEEDALNLSLDMVNAGDEALGWLWVTRERARIAAFRGMVEEFAPMLDSGDAVGHYTTAALLYLASIWNDHPDYNNLWKP